MFWVEIASHPLRVRGLKLREPQGNLPNAIVASFTGAWIETDNGSRYRYRTEGVASFTGAWIETTMKEAEKKDLSSRILYGCDTYLSQSVQIIIVSIHLGSSFHDQELLYKNIIINKIQTTTTKKYHYSSIDCSYVIYLF